MLCSALARLQVGFVAGLLAAASFAHAQDKTPEKAAEKSAAKPLEFKPLFNGKDLTGWVRVNCAPGTFTVRDGTIVSTGIPTGVLRTDRMYENYVVELEWKHLVPRGNAGLFVHSDDLPVRGQPFTRGIEVQILDGHESNNYTSHGDVFAIHGATFLPDRPHPGGWMRCLPSEKRAKPAGEWNHYRVECLDGSIKLSVNGKEVSGGTKCNPRKGYICLEAEGSECHFRNLRIHELPGSNTSPEQTAISDRGFQSLYTGVDLAGWKAEEANQGRWTAKDWTLIHDGSNEAKDLWTEKSYKNFTLIADWRLTASPKTKPLPVIQSTGEAERNADGTPRLVDAADAGECGILLRGDAKSRVSISCWPLGSGDVPKYREAAAGNARQTLTPRQRGDAPPGKWNRFVITLKNDRLTVLLNDRIVLQDAVLTGIPPNGPLGLEHRGAPIEFANLFVRELPDE